MKTIQPISIWDNGELKQATVLNAYSSTVILGQSATFYYSLHTTDGGMINGMLAQGNLDMTGEDYQKWIEDEYAWDFVAAKLKLVITGDYQKPVPVEPEVVAPKEPVADPVETTEETTAETTAEETAAE